MLCHPPPLFIHLKDVFQLAHVIVISDNRENTKRLAKGQ
jgi:hypothetical protein